MNTTTKVLIGLGALAVVGGVSYYFYNKSQTGETDETPKVTAKAKSENKIVLTRD